MTAVEKLRSMLADPNKFLSCPGVYDGFTARIALQEGVDCLYMVRLPHLPISISTNIPPTISNNTKPTQLTHVQTGAGTTMSRLGAADMGIATFTDMLTNASMLASLSPSTPLIADADTGYGGPVMVGRTVTSYIRAGVAGLHLEDQIVSKRCGHLNGKQLVDIEEFEARIRAARLARLSLIHI